MTDETEAPEVKATRQLHDIAVSTGMDHQTVMGIAGIFKRLNDAEAERDAALAVIEQASALADAINVYEVELTGPQGGLARLRHLLSQSPASALAKVKADAWDECLDALEQHELNTAQAREGNPYRTEAT